MARTKHILCSIFGAFFILTASAQAQQVESEFRFFATESNQFDLTNFQPAAPALWHQAAPILKKTQAAAVGHAIVLGYFLPAAFGHAYSGAQREAAVITAARVTGRVMWVQALADSLIVKGADRRIGTSDQIFMFIGAALDVGGYLYDIFHSPVALSKQNPERVARNNTKLRPFVDYVGDAPCCGLQVRF